MSRFTKLAHVIFHLKYHIVWVPKYRYRVLDGVIGKEVRNEILLQTERLKCNVVELNVQKDHVHLLVGILPKILVSNFMGVVKGKTAIKIFQKFPQLKKKLYWGNHFWAEGYCVDTVGLNSEMIRKYIKHQEKNEKG